MSWRKIYGITLFAGFIGAFSPFLLTLWTLILGTLLFIDIYKRKAEIKDKRLLKLIN